MSEELERTLRIPGRNFLSPEVRKSPQRVSALLADEFIEIGRSGRFYSKTDILSLLAEEAPTELTLSDFTRQVIIEGVVLVTTVR